ncbi:unnamed protein product [Durusdinium trenchii]|uniref:Uncharacterized protein n=1 Tax=Durusdinium trenchii TaxID=1381693 RepID=A0ABP0LD34_9DINO
MRSRNQDYKGARDYEALNNFTKVNLGPSCGPERLELCDEMRRKQIEELLALPMSELKYKIKRKEDQIAAAEKELKGFIAKLEKKYDEAVQVQEKKQKAIKQGGLNIMKAVQAYNRRAKPKKPERSRGTSSAHSRDEAEL